MTPEEHWLSQRETMLARVRTGFALAAILVIQLNPERVARFPILSQASLLSFLIYSLIVLYLTKSEKFASGKIGLATTFLDFLWVTLLVYSTGASRTPFFVFYLFPVITASSRWGIKGGLLASLVGVALWGWIRFGSPWPDPLGIDTFIIRSIYLIVLGYIFGFISDFERKQNARLLALYKTAGQAATQEERRRIARELHDRLLQTLASLTLRLETCRKHLLDSPKELEQEMQLLEDSARSSMDEIRRFLAGKDSRGVPPGTLMERLREDIRFLRDGLGLTVTLESDPEELSFPPEIEEQVYYVLREGLMNIVRHSHASRAELLLKQTNGEIQAAISDDGVGFDLVQAKDGSGFGLVSMKERIKKFGGSLLIESTPAGGTKISFRLPLESK